LEPQQKQSKDLFATWWEGDYGLGNWGGVREELAEKGLEFNILSVNELWSNVSGGIATGTDFIGYWEWGFVWEMEPMLGWKGGSIAVDGNWYYGNLPSDDLVGLYPATAVSSYESSNALRFYHIYFQQAWGRPFDENTSTQSASPTLQDEQPDGHYIFKIGQIAADDDFMGTVYGGLFTNASFGQYPKEAGATAAPAYRLTAPGVFFSAQPVEEWFMRVGAYSGNAGEDIDSNNGFGWRWGGATGIATFAETGVEIDIAGRPGTYVVGGFYDTSEFETFDGGTTRGNWNIWFTLDQAILMQSNGEDTLLGVFFRAVPGPANNRNPIDWGMDGGIVLFGEPWGRPADEFGIAVTTANFPHQVVVDEELNAGEQTIVELTYLWQVNNWLSVQPDVQFIIDPSFADRDAVAVGLRVSAEL